MVDSIEIKVLYCNAYFKYGKLKPLESNYDKGDY